MRFFTTLTAFTTLVLATAARAATTPSKAADPAIASIIPPTYYIGPVTWDSTYDNPEGDMNTVACSNGDNGLNPPYAQFGDLPNFPYIGGSSFVEAWNSPNCGSCWKLTYKGTSIYVTLVDSYYQGFNIAKEAMDVLTDNNSDDGPVQIVATQAPKSYCGF
ncbi:Cerato-platanin-domain-containing protein [Cubamyces sp. BRFM 1775]|nr:Cerato-platanin-domain-containing protein [Cubamyces sp. BRFM 1775]